MVVTLAPPGSQRVQWRILLHVEGGRIILEKAQQSLAFLGECDGRALRQRGKGCNGKRGRLLLALYAPRARDPSIDENRGRDTAILRPQNELAMLVPKHPRPVGVRKQ